jgi:hypothetical protein
MGTSIESEIGAMLDSACQSFDPGKFPSDKAFGQAPLIYRIHAFAAGASHLGLQQRKISSRITSFSRQIEFLFPYGGSVSWQR